jgi:hypothetical protein
MAEKDELTVEQKLAIAHYHTSFALPLQGIAAMVGISVEELTDEVTDIVAAAGASDRTRRRRRARAAAPAGNGVPANDADQAD